MSDRNAFSRRELFAGAAGLAASARGAASTRPNVLFIMVDEMRWDAMSAEKHPVVSTPNLDRLSSQGTRFAKAYTVAPVCSPSRACSFAGRYADVVGVTNNGVPAHQGEIFLPSILRHYGYHTAIAGKLHYTPIGYGYGFDQFWSFSAEGPTPELGLGAYLRKKHGGPGIFPIVPGTCPWPDDILGRDVGVFRYPEEDFETNWVTDRSIEYLHSRKESSQPWFLFTSYLKPHSPSVLPQKYFAMYDPKAIPIPKLPANAKEVRAAHNGHQKRHYIDDEQMLRTISAIYYGAVYQVDQQIGRLLKELERLQMADNTLVLFTADHGNMLGDRGRMFKEIMYEGATHVPLILRGPKGSLENTGRVENKIVENTDLLPTILEYIGIPVPHGVQGQSVLKLTRGKASTWKDRCYSQLSTAMVRSGQWKFIDNSRDLSRNFELYDMRNDPKEERNVVGDPKHKDLVADFKTQLITWRADRPAPIKITGMPTPDYALNPEEESRTQRLRMLERRKGPRTEP